MESWIGAFPGGGNGEHLVEEVGDVLLPFGRPAQRRRCLVDAERVDLAAEPDEVEMPPQPSVISLGG